MKQEELARKAQVSRAVLSRLEQGKPKPVQSDTLDRLLSALELRPRIAGSSGDVSRRIARLEQEIRQRERRERHLRLALSLGEDGSSAAARIAKARQRVDCYTRNDPGRIFDIAEALGAGSKFEEEHGYYLDPISPDLPTLPDNWEFRLVPVEMQKQSRFRQTFFFDDDEREQAYKALAEDGST